MPSPGRSTRKRTAKVADEEPPTAAEKQNNHHKDNHIHPETPTRHSARLQAKHDEEEGIHVLKPTLEEVGLSTYSTARVGKTKELDFGGWIGASCMTLSLPVAVFYLTFMCQKDSCTVMKLAKCPSKLSTYFDLNATLIFFGWMAFQVLLAVLPIGSVVEGVVLKSGHRLSYRCNGFISLLLSCAAFAGLVYMKKPVVYVYDHFIALLTSAVIFSIVASLCLYIRARRARNADLSPAGNSGYLIYDFFMGHELNPRIGSLDLKFFCELRPGLIGWVMLNFCFIARDCMDNKFPSYPLLLVSAFHLIYVMDALWFEDSILTTMDITHEGFGFMLCFGDIAWVPFLYTLSTRFLLEHPQMLPTWALAAIAFLNLLGYIIFRGSNSQKNEFRKNPFDPALSHLESIPTSAGKRLLVSGWWGLCRHPNYLGDIIMAIAWSIPCGFKFALPHFYAVYLVMLLVSRAYRDDHFNKKKYGHAWDRYRQRVPYMIIPKIF
ncbi:delta(14)-sterol reductase TM7SF2-like isoform X2 [Tubulanus polymorphus]